MKWLALALLLSMSACNQPEGKGRSCFHTNGVDDCVAACRAKYTPDTDKILACQRGVREEKSLKERNDEAFGRNN